MKTIDIGGIALFGIVALTGLTGYTVKSCNQRAVEDHKISIQDEEIALKKQQYEDSAPCITHDEVVSREEVSSSRHGIVCPRGSTLSDIDTMKLSSGEWEQHFVVRCTCPVPSTPSITTNNGPFMPFNLVRGNQEDAGKE